MRYALALLTALASHGVAAATATVAVAANFLVPAQELVARLGVETGHEIVLVGGSTGQLYAQILNGAPFDVFLAADAERPRMLADAGLADAQTRRVYAVGLLALWTRRKDLIGASGLAVLESTDYRWLAIANPELAPYGVAARQVIERLGLTADLADRIVLGQSIAQTFAMVDTAAADLGLVALSQALAYAGDAAWVKVPPELHEPIRQEAIRLKHGRDNPAAAAFLEFLASPAGVEIIRRFGYDVDSGQ